MKRTTLFSVLFACFALFILFVVGASPAPYNVSIKQILDSPYDLDQETVRLEGKIIKFAETKAASNRAFILQDDWGDEIKIITNNVKAPELNRNYLVTGMVFVGNSDTDKENPEIYIFEISREIPLDDRQGETSPSTGQPPTVKKNGKVVKVLFFIAAALLMVIAVLAVYMITGKNRGSSTPGQPSFPGLNVTDSGLAGAPEPLRYIDDSTDRAPAVPGGTLIALTGWFEVISGYDQLKQIRFFKPPSQGEPEFTFGREPGAPYVHFQLNSPTVSANQAKLRLTNGKFLLINFSMSSPTKVDGRALEKEESVILKDDSRIEMGEITLKFHEK